MIGKRLLSRAVALAMATVASAARAHEVSPAGKKTFDPATVEEAAFGRAGDPRKVSS